MSSQADMFDGVFYNRRTGHVEKYINGRLITHFRAGLRPPLAKRFGMDADPESYPDFPGNSALLPTAALDHTPSALTVRWSAELPTS